MGMMALPGISIEYYAAIQNYNYVANENTMPLRGENILSHAICIYYDKIRYACEECKIMSKNKGFFPPQILFLMLKNKGKG